MAEAPVLIVGAGIVGLTLGQALKKVVQIHAVISYEMQAGS